MVVDGGFKGRVYPVNPVRVDEELFGWKYYANVKDIPESIDTAVIAVPARLVNEVIIELGKKENYSNHYLRLR